jgi:hypothetical protein
MPDAPAAGPHPCQHRGVGAVQEAAPAVGGGATAGARRQPGWAFHVGVGVLAVPLLWSATSPAGGGGFLLWAVTGALLFAAAVAWVGWLAAWARRRGTREPGRRFLVAPIGGVVFVALLALMVPVRARWLVGRGDFDRLLEVAAATDPDAAPFEPVDVEVPDRLGTYAVDRAVRVGDDLFVFLDIAPGAGGPFLVDAGFAHLPNGLREPLSPGGVPLAYDRVEATHLWGDWYTWSGYW